LLVLFGLVALLCFASLRLLGFGDEDCSDLRLQADFKASSGLIAQGCSKSQISFNPLFTRKLLLKTFKM
jgi:hypothetical protein